MVDRAVADVTETRDQLESSRARHAQDAYHQRRRADKLYTQLRLLENAVRDTIAVGERPNSEALYNLRQRVPNKPRSTLVQLRKGKKNAR